jgi:cysteine desulfurase
MSSMADPHFCYLDNNATTRIAPEVLDAMLPALTEHWGNPSSAYEFGTRTARMIDEAREQVAALVGAEPREIVFTSCGTESNNAAIHSALRLNPGKRHVVTTAVEHSANIKYGRHLIQQGYEVTFLPVEPDGSLDVHLLEQAIRPDTAIVSVMYANNETGVIFPIEEIAAICRYKEVPCHTDAVQTPGKLKLDVKALDVDFLSLSGHKLHAPKGIGMLYVRSGARLQPYVIGGGQERGRRGGTENVPYIIGFGRAAELAANSIAEENIRVRALRDRLEETILRTIPGAARNGARDERLCNTSNISFPNLEAEAILKKLDQAGICAASGSACTTGSLDPSHVLIAMGMSPARALGSVRFSLGIYNKDADIDYVLAKLPGLIEELRAETP